LRPASEPGGALVSRRLPEMLRLTTPSSTLGDTPESRSRRASRSGQRLLVSLVLVLASVIDSPKATMAPPAPVTSTSVRNGHSQVVRCTGKVAAPVKLPGVEI
jgi:hypothetical protein